MYEFLIELIFGFLRWLKDSFSNIFQGLGNILGSFANFMGQVLGNLGQSLANVILWILTPIIDLVYGLIFFIGKIGEVIKLVIILIITLFQFVGQLISDVFAALAGLNYTGSAAAYNIPGAYQGGFQAILGFFDQTGFSTIAYIFAFFVWIFTAVAVIKIATKKG